MGKTMAYDHPTYTVRHGAPLNLAAVAVSTTAGKFLAFAATRIKSVSAVVNVAGTNTAAGYDIYNGTSSVGSILAGTNAAGSVLTTFTEDVELDAGEFLDIKTNSTGATLAASVMIEHEIVAGGTVTS